MIEGMAQTAGILTGEARGFVENVILAKIRNARFSGYARPGDQLRYDATLESIDERASLTSGLVLNNGTQIGQVDLIFSLIKPGEDSRGLPNHNFVFTDEFMSLLAAFRDPTADGRVEPDEC
jgi:3-hydroxyacyl-[acyl-carrier-protein] dehydratase